MKKWNAPEMVELNITETANGCWDVDYEGCFDFIFTEGNKADKEDKTPEES